MRRSLYGLIAGLIVGGGNAFITFVRAIASCGGIGGLIIARREVGAIGIGGESMLSSSVLYSIVKFLYEVFWFAFV